jgi:hypothetical protein
MTTRRPRSDSEEDDIPLHHKKPFGAGLKRKKIEFVRAQDKDEGITAASNGPTKGAAIGACMRALSSALAAQNQDQL